MARLSNAVRSVSDLPGWFDLKKYEFTAELDSAGWYEQLFAREQLFLLMSFRRGADGRQINETVAFEVASEIWSKTNISFGESNVLSSVCGFDGAMSRVRSDYSRPVHSLTYRQYLQQGDRIKVVAKEKADNWWRNVSRDDLSLGSVDLNLARQVMGFVDLPLYMSQEKSSLHTMANVDLTMPDTVLLEAFKTWLVKAKSDFYLSSGKQYRKPDLSAWRRLGVLPYIDLISWAELSGKSIPNRVMANAIFPTGEGGEETIRKTTAPLAVEIVGRGEHSDRTILDTLLAVAALEGGAVGVG
ncbi:DUF6387 family protein [Pseudomonas sp. stari2]|uniref:DUF6387 family protein n=1 Tax=Pseudomonas sp. Stari2 TaxID=2954814 RepID=UPI00345DFC3F